MAIAEGVRLAKMPSSSQICDEVEGTYKDKTAQ